MKELSLLKPNFISELYNHLAKKGEFINQWKKALLILLIKVDEPLDSIQTNMSSRYRRKSIRAPDSDMT